MEIELSQEKYPVPSPCCPLVSALLLHLGLMLTKDIFRGQVYLHCRQQGLSRIGVLPFCEPYFCAYQSFWKMTISIQGSYRIG